MDGLPRVSTVSEDGVEVPLVTHQTARQAADWHKDRLEDLRAGNTDGLTDEEAKKLMAFHAQEAARFRELARGPGR